MSVRYALVGYARLTFDTGNMATVLNYCMTYRLVYYRFETGQETVSFEMPLPGARFLLRLCEKNGVPVRQVRYGGLIHFLERYHRRLGLVIGAVMGIWLAVASGRVLWDIRVEGNQLLTKRQVLEELENSGMRVGMSLTDWDRHETEMRILLDSDLISWVSVNMVGTVAYVEIRERVPLPKEPETLSPANLVADREGVVERVEAYAGFPVVKAGQRVAAGELLISGLYDSQSRGYRITRAAGAVMARTVRDFSVEVPLQSQQKVYTGERKTEKTLIFFGKELKLFKNSGICGESCDKIDNVDSITSGEGATVPISLHTMTYLPYTMQDRTRSADMARALAYYELERQISQALPEGELLNKTVLTTLTDDCLRLDCRVTVLEDIARLREFSVDCLPPGGQDTGAGA